MFLIHDHQLSQQSRVLSEIDYMNYRSLNIFISLYSHCTTHSSASCMFRSKIVSGGALTLNHQLALCNRECAPNIVG